MGHTNLGYWRPHFRLTRLEFDPSKYDAMVAYADTQIEALKGISGLKAVRTVRIAEDRSITIARYDSKEAADAVVEQVGAVWAGFADFMTEEPLTRQGEMVWSYEHPTAGCLVPAHKTMARPEGPTLFLALWLGDIIRNLCPMGWPPRLQSQSGSRGRRAQNRESECWLAEHRHR